MPQGALGDLVVRMALDVARFRDDIGKTRRVAQRGAQRIKAAFAGIGAAISVRGFLNIAKAADEIGKSAGQLGLTAEQLQVLRFAAEQSGVAVGTLEMAIQRMGRRAGEAVRGENKRLAELAEEIGISFTDASGKMRSANAIFRDVVDALSRMEDPLKRNAVAMRFFDSEGVKVVRIAEQGAGALKDFERKARDLGIVISNDTVAKSADLNDSLNVLSKVIKVNLTEAVLAIAPLLTAMAKEVADLAKEWAALFPSDQEVMLENTRGALAKINEQITEQANLVFELKKSLDAGIKNEEQRNAVIKVYSRELEELNVLQEQRKALEEELAGATDKGNEALKDQAGALNDAAGAMEKHASKTDAAAEKQRRLFKSIQSEVDALALQAKTFGLSAKEASLYRLEVEGANEAQLAQARSALDVLGNLQEQQKLQADAASVIAATRTEQEQFNSELERYQELLAAGAIDQETYVRAVTEARDGLVGMKDAAKEAGDDMKDFAKEAAQAIEGQFSSGFFDIMQGRFDGLASGFKATIDRMVADLLASQLFDLLKPSGGAGGGIGGAIAGLAGSLFGGKAIGGPVTAGRPYVVGERGPEVFVPPSAGTVRPGGGQAVNVTNQFVIQTPTGQVGRETQQQIAARSGEMVNRALRRNR